MISLFWKIAFHIVLIVCIGKRELDPKMAELHVSYSV